MRYVNCATQSTKEISRLTGCSVKQAINDLNLLIEDGVLMGYGEGRNVVYAKPHPKA
ncbi:hypothetical protein [uncultured Bacteroides sp.]|uniref:hypothetical protein n=1 Tax=uncultured Bacteroides sp. TaxID=162156 RepID=UPI0025FEBE42|nr:hypothetical protein [uncultured Bacteroides sp.]